MKMIMQQLECQLLLNCFEEEEEKEEKKADPEERTLRVAAMLHFEYQLPLNLRDRKSARGRTRRIT